MENELNILFWLGTFIMITMALMVMALLIAYQKNINAYHNEHLKQQLKVIIETEHKQRARLAKDLHDGLCCDLATIQNFVALYESSKDKEVKEMALEEVKLGLLECYNQTLSLSYNLSPPLIKSNPLELIIKNYISRINKVSNISIEVKANSQSFELKELVKLEFYRILQELIQNILKHSFATVVSIDLNWNNSSLVISVLDNGIAYNSKLDYRESSNGLGLSNIQTRIKQINAVFNHQILDTGNLVTITFNNYDY
ncbi:histidine kinase [Myroides marinus]|uniref:sensor histidine kinase n=1 Tax=Myroides marinus TaxID=703342 RepID=UPI002576DA25|nr:ATP-binding protein [Myroides marinus]MDM1352196.1 histidine kinase [Myroides marinus]MDM1359418.1 histidine kinase [Myroides marinus]